MLSSSSYGDSKSLPKIEGNEGKVLSPYALTKKVNEIMLKYIQRFIILTLLG